MIVLVEVVVESRLIQFLFDAPVSDGGQWDMVINLLEKYGVVPKCVCPESYNSSNSAQMMEEVYRIIAISLGKPPKVFDWAFRDKDGKYYEFFGNNFMGRLSTIKNFLVNDPRHPYFNLYTVEYLGNIQGGIPIRYVNILIETMKQLTIQALRSGKPVWLGADVGKASDSSL
ncbi:21001_t:CDS:2 [Cetraspora pellucida]|uniref:21001_t:CDS:1 n=1 Tax=Cetraspora pellucida TaxID=1433469 RepID=A0A9N9HM96_9GLOM|nr:21001_t:CDS:2 [Cetraspora pellucida]